MDVDIFARRAWLLSQMRWHAKKTTPWHKRQHKHYAKELLAHFLKRRTEFFSYSLAKHRQKLIENVSANNALLNKLKGLA